MTELRDLQVGVTFASDFQIERLLAKGGMGAVYVVRQLSTGRQRALKLMHPMLTSDEGLRKRFEQEARIGAQIKSSHVVEVIAAGIDAASATPWLAMELLEGEDLGDYVGRNGPRPLGEVAAIMGQLCHALAAAHEAGVVHRDLKPENVFLARSLQQGAPVLVKLLDLGIAKIVAENSPQQTASIGTPLWMAPEQMGGSVGPQADVWALGLLAYWMLTGTHYWRSATAQGEGLVMAVLREVAADPIEPASVRAQSLGVAAPLPAGFDAWFARTVQRDPSQRFANAAQTLQAFEALAAGAAQTMIAPSGLVQRLSPGAYAPTQAVTGNATPGPLSGTKPAAKSNDRARAVLAALGFIVLLVGSFAFLSFRYVAGAGKQLQARLQQGRGTAASASAAPSSAKSASSKAAAPTSSAEPSPEREAADLKDGNLVWRIPVGDSPTRGPSDAPVTIVELANYQCPFSRGVEPAMSKLLSDYAGKVRLVWKDDPLAVHSQAELAASVAREARAQQGDTGFWAAHDLMLAPDFKPNDASLREIGKKLGLDQARLEHSLSDHIYADPIARDAELADDFMAVGTPYLFVNGRRVVTTGSLDKVRSAIDEELAKVDGWTKQGIAGAHIYEHLMSDARGPLPLELKPFAFQSVVGPTRGAQKADVLLAEFCDYKSYLCKLVDPMVDELLGKFPHDLGVTWIEPDHFSSDDAQRAAVAARAAYNLGGVDTFDKMRRLLFERQAQPMSPPLLRGYAKSVGLLPAQFDKEVQSAELFGAVEIEASLAKRFGIQEVPTFLVCGTDFCANGGYLLHGGQPRRAFEKRVRLVLAAAGHPLSATP